MGKKDKGEKDKKDKKDKKEKKEKKKDKKQSLSFYETANIFTEPRQNKLGLNPFIGCDGIIGEILRLCQLLFMLRFWYPEEIVHV